jgi:hypothetical protein
MNKKVTFLLGAGASCGAMPLTANLPTRMKGIIDLIDNENFPPSSLKTTNDITPQKIQLTESAKEFVQDLKWLHDMSSKHASIDTFAKKLYLTNAPDHEIFTLKHCLSVYFLIEQGLQLVDQRYDPFFASLLISKSLMPSNIKVVSWNYDLQFELGFQVYSGDKTLYDSQMYLGHYHKYINNFVDSDIHENRFGLYKLNGSCTMFGSSPMIIKKNYYPDVIPDSLNAESLEDLLRIYVDIKQNYSKYQCGLSFAWEEDHPNLTKGIVEVASIACKDTEVLVVIGYSFPFFNRDIDRKVIGGMTNLKKIYIQAPDADDLKEKFLSIRDNFDSSSIITLKKHDQFFLPDVL